MATPFNTVYESFLSQVTDYELANMEDVDLEDNLQQWLMNAIGFFANSRQNLYDLDLTLKQFNIDLSVNETQILAKLMLASYMNTHIIKEDLMRQTLNSKDYRMYSPANQIEALIKIKENVDSEANTLMSRYSYRLSNVRELFKK
jgi:hypothetical protein